VVRFGVTATRKLVEAIAAQAGCEGEIGLRRVARGQQMVHQREQVGDERRLDLGSLPCPVSPHVSGVRLTHQRRTILGVVETAKQHLDASQILRQARRLDPGIDRVTVYRTLKLLKRHGLVDELDLMHMQGEKHFYERRPQRDHIHMACLRCGKIAEFESDLFDRLKGQIQRDCRFHIVVSRLEVGGYCTQCRSASSSG